MAYNNFSKSGSSLWNVKGLYHCVHSNIWVSDSPITFYKQKFVFFRFFFSIFILPFVTISSKVNQKKDPHGIDLVVYTKILTLQSLGIYSTYFIVIIVLKQWRYPPFHLQPVITNTYYMKVNQASITWDGTRLIQITWFICLSLCSKATLRQLDAKPLKALPRRQFYC